jgi:hypothetical protein
MNLSHSALEELLMRSHAIIMKGTVQSAARKKVADLRETYGISPLPHCGLGDDITK